MRAYRALLATNYREFVRDRAALFWTFAFPLYLYAKKNSNGVSIKNVTKIKFIVNVMRLSIATPCSELAGGKIK